MRRYLMIKKVFMIIIGLMIICMNIVRVESVTTYANGAKSALLMDASCNESLKWDDQVTTSSYVANMGGSQIHLEENETLSVKDMFESVAIANDVPTAL